MEALPSPRVLDVAELAAGSLRGRSFGDTDADVLEVEPCAIADDARRWPPFQGDAGARDGAARGRIEGATARCRGLDLPAVRVEKQLGESTADGTAAVERPRPGAGTRR